MPRDARTPSLLALILFAALAAAVPVQGAEPDYPATTPGRNARDYFVAYQTGESAMRDFWTTHGAAAALAERPVEPRLGVWRQMVAEHGRLTPERVTASGDDFVEVLARDEHGQEVAIRFACEPGPAHGLVALRIEDAGAEGGGGAAPPPSPPADPGPPPTDAEIVARLGTVADSLASAGAFSGAIGFDENGRTRFAHAYGMASRSKHVANTLETRFNLGSINKIFTHVAIEQLAQQGKLGLDDTLARFLPDYPAANARRITLRMLLEHRAGVPDVLMNPALRDHPNRIRTLADWYGLIRDMPLDFDPGTRQRYSNGGFVLLGEVVARVSGEDYYDYIRKHVYGPAGMTRSDHYANDEPLADRATPYARDPGDSGADTSAAELDPAGQLGRGSPAGGGYATIGDMIRFGRALRGGRLLDAAHTRDMLGDPVWLGIAGGSPGVNGLLIIAGPYTFVALANLDPPAAEQLAPNIGRMIRRAAHVPPPSPSGGPRAGQ